MEEHERKRQPEDNDMKNDEQKLLTLAESLYQEDKLSQVAKILHSLSPELLNEKHSAMLKRAQEAEDLVQDLKYRPDNKDSSTSCSSFSGEDNRENWIDQGVSRGKFPTRILYRLEQQQISGDAGKVKLRARCETPIPRDLLEPLLSVLNETELYETWLPSFNVPKFKIQKCKKLKQSGRVSQILLVCMDLPWPMAAREVVLSAAAFDAIEDDGHIGIKLKTIGTEDDEVVPEADPNTVRVDVDGGFLFEACPMDHPALEFMEHTKWVDCILVTFSAVMDPHMKLLPQSFLNFLVKTALGTAWRMLLSIAQDVKDGKRPDHASAIERKRNEVYDYVRERVEVMLSSLNHVGVRDC